MNEAQRHLLIGRYRRRIAELEADRDRWEESSGNWQTLYQQECDRREEAETRLANIAALCDHTTPMLYGARVIACGDVRRRLEGGL